MLNLLKVDFRRFKKDLIFRIILILIVCFSLGTVLLYQLLSVASKDAESIKFIQETLCGKFLFINALSPSQNIGLAFPILYSAILAKDYANGTIRNKLINGYSKSQIYASSLITVLVFGLSSYIVNALLNLALGSLLFGFGPAITASEIGRLFLNLGLATLIFSVFLAFSTMVCHLTKSVVGSIMITLGFILIISIIGSILADIPSLNSFAHFIYMINPSMQIYDLGAETLTNEFFLYSIICSIIYLTGSTCIGTLISRRTDIK